MQTSQCTQRPWTASLGILRKQPTLRDATTGFLVKWRMINERRNFILMARHYLGWVVLLIGWSKFPTRYEQLEALPSSGWWHVISMEFLNSFFRRFFAEKPVVASWNVGCFLKQASVPNWNQSSILKNYETWIKGNLYCLFMLSFKWWTLAKKETESETLS